MPDNPVLCALLGVPTSGSDPLTLDDLRSAPATRRACHRALIQRRPAAYATAWLGLRLGMSARTLRRYNHAIPHLHVAPTFTQTPLSRWNLHAIPTEPLPGVCLEDSSGRRYPPLQALAARLLAQGRAVALLAQGWSYYWYGAEQPPPALDGALPAGVPKPFGKPPLRFEQSVHRLIRVVAQARDTRPSLAVKEKPAPAPVPDSADAHSPPLHPPAAHAFTRTDRRYRQPLPHADLEALAARLYALLNARTPAAEHRVSLPTARWLVERYGPARIAQGLAALERRQGVYKPVGWLCTWLRTSA